MIPRMQNLKTQQSLFLFGARGTGKSTLLSCLFGQKNHILWINLLDYKQESVFSKTPDRLSFLIAENNSKIVIIDEVQKIPKLLDIVHKEIEKSYGKIKFIITGSSARKLKKGKANLLAGRAVAYYLYPFSVFELKKKVNLQKTLQFGALPKLSHLGSQEEKILFLESYVQNYLKEEVLQEQLVRKIQPFKNFLEITAQLNGQIINYSKFAREIGSDHKTVQNYFSVLEDTLLGFHLFAYSPSARKQYQTAPKFYLFDLGVKRALENTLHIPLSPKTFAFGRAFEHFIFLECVKLNHYFKRRYKFYYCKTKSGLELDLLVKRAGKKDILIEIKSTDQIREDHIKSVKHFSSFWKAPHTTQVWSLDKDSQRISGVQCLHWKTALAKLFNQALV